MKNKLEGQHCPPFCCEEQHTVDMETKVFPTDRPLGDLDQERRTDSATKSFLPVARCSEANGGSCGRLMKPSGSAHTRTSRLHSKTGDGRRKTCFQKSEPISSPFSAITVIYSGIKTAINDASTTPRPVTFTLTTSEQEDQGQSLNVSLQMLP